MPKVRRGGRPSREASEQLGELILGYLARFLEHPQDLITAVQQARTVEIPEGFQATAIGGLPLGDGDQDVIAHHLA